MTTLPAAVAARIDLHLAALDARLPGFADSVYVVGSAALGAWQPDRSDIDLLIVTGRTATADDLATLGALHETVLERPYLDAVYLDRGSLAAQPADRRQVPFAVDGRLRTDTGCGELTPVLWLTLRRYGVAVRGPEAADLGIRPDPDGLRRYNLDNLREYWQPLAAQIRMFTDGSPDDTPVPADQVVWMLLGPARLHRTLAHGDIITKSAAAAYLGEHFPQWAEPADRAARHRSGQDVTFTIADLRAGADLTDAVTTDAWSRFAPTP
ncbi:nucleotidyltransferase domain-containing protein [Catellatospora sp. KI3]|uniref:nucleotidyltransferase domain-containing protein n=1 Tax=Catellatospora sp. KI3 TaxID=3041620 RepID=UPI002482230D|nr:nucleotidyltransferase domain-containing protein [Catellatospora sp. KI3]MDI1466134.1 nucleotidyltransferase domain-containing protein [Catellatospora sp. KI3]